MSERCTEQINLAPAHGYQHRVRHHRYLLIAMLDRPFFPSAVASSAIDSTSVHFPISVASQCFMAPLTSEKKGKRSEQAQSENGMECFPLFVPHLKRYSPRHRVSSTTGGQVVGMRCRVQEAQTAAVSSGSDESEGEYIPTVKKINMMGASDVIVIFLVFIHIGPTPHTLRRW